MFVEDSDAKCKISKSNYFVQFSKAHRGVDDINVKFNLIKLSKMKLWSDKKQHEFALESNKTINKRE